MIQTIFWCSALFIFYTYAGYPLLLWAWRRLARPAAPRRGTDMPAVSILVTVRNEAAHIEQKIQDLLAIDYPSESFEILIASDASTDGTQAIVRDFNAPRVRLIDYAQRIGKAEAINRTVPLARGEVLVLMDARQRVDPGAVAALVGNFADPEVGMVGGELVLLDDQGQPSSESTGLYWRYETWVRTVEADLKLLAGVSGCCFAIRKCLFQPAPAGSILDDVVYPLQVLVQGKRVWWEKSARVYDSVMPAEQELKRKVRSLVGNYQLLFRFWRLFCPWHGRTALSLVSHKLCRLLVPLALLAMVVTSATLFGRPLYAAALSLQSSLYALGIAGILSGWARRHSRLINACCTFCLLNLAALMAMGNFLVRGQKVAWR